jgi:uncharacterized protein (DUF1919 family)
MLELGQKSGGYMLSFIKNMEKRKKLFDQLTFIGKITVTHSGVQNFCSQCEITQYQKTQNLT